MLYLQFWLGDERYALETRTVVQVVPYLPVRALAGVADTVAGLIDFRGQPVPVLDLCQLRLGRPCQRVYSTRIIVIQYPIGEAVRLLGLLAERVTETLERPAEDFQEPGLTLDQARYLGPVARQDQGWVQCLRPQHLLSAEARDQLFALAEQS